MHRAAALLSVLCVMAPAYAGESLSMREYEERCASYYARQYGVSPALVRAIIQIESAWQPGVVSSKGDGSDAAHARDCTALWRDAPVLHPRKRAWRCRVLGGASRTLSWRPSPGYGRLCGRREADSRAETGLL